MTTPFVIDNTLLLNAAESLERPHCPHCGERLDRWHPDAEILRPGGLNGEVHSWQCPACGEDLDSEYQGCCEESAAQLREIAAAARNSTERNERGWPYATVQVQGTCGD